MTMTIRIRAIPPTTAAAIVDTARGADLLSSASTDVVSIAVLVGGLSV